MRMWYMSWLKESERESYANIQVMRIPEFQTEKKAGAKILRPGYISDSLKNSKVGRVARVE